MKLAAGGKKGLLIKSTAMAKAEWVVVARFRYLPPLLLRV